MIKRKAGRPDRLKCRVAEQFPVVQLIGIGGLEQQPAELDDLHQQPVACLNRPIVDQSGVGQAFAGAGFARETPLIGGQAR